MQFLAITTIIMCGKPIDGALLDLLDARKHGYLIKVKLKNLVVLLTGQQWAAIAGQPDWEQCTL